MPSQQYYERWAKWVLEDWEEKIQKMNIIHTGDLLRSLEEQVIANADGSVAKVQFFFNYYGKFVDMGAGPVNQPQRKPKPWFSKTFFKQVNNITVNLSKEYGRRIALTIAETISDK